MKIDVHIAGVAVLDYTILMSRGYHDFRASEEGELYIKRPGSDVYVDMLPEADQFDLQWLMVNGKIGVYPTPDKGWEARSFADATVYNGCSPYTAAARCYIAGVYGPTIYVPEELV